MIFLDFFLSNFVENMNLTGWDGDVLVVPDDAGRIIQPSGTSTICSLSILDSHTIMGDNFKNQGNPLFSSGPEVLVNPISKSHMKNHGKS